MLSDTTAHAMGSVDISQGPYGGNIVGQRKKKKKCKDDVTELRLDPRKYKDKPKKERLAHKLDMKSPRKYNEDVVTEIAAFLMKRASKKRVEMAAKLAARGKKIRADRYKLTPSELKAREENLEAAKARARKKMFAAPPTKAKTRY